MSQRVIAALAIVALALATLGFTSAYVVAEGEQAVITEFGRPLDDAITEAGVYFKLPWQTVNRFEKRIMRWDGQRNEIPTKDKKFIWVDTTARWRIVDPLKFLQSVRGSYTTAASRLDDLIDGAVRDAVSSNLLLEMVRSRNRETPQPEVAFGDAEGELTSELYTQMEKGRQAIERGILLAARESIQEQYGIELVDVLVTRVNYIPDVAQTVFQRMIAERQKIANKFRSEGEGRKEEIDGERGRKLATIQSDGYRQAQEIRGEGDAEATRIYAEAYGRDPEFYSFWRSLEIMPDVIGRNSRIVLGTDSELYQFLEGGELAPPPKPPRARSPEPAR